MSTFRDVRLASWGLAPEAVSREWKIAAGVDVQPALKSAGARGAIARGYGRSYGDACLNGAGDVLDLTQVSAVSEFNRDSGVIVCGGGVSYSELMRRCVPHGWLPAVCPGTAIVSMAGAVANDVHGKNHHWAGSFGEHIDWVELVLADGEFRRVTRESDPELFHATVGGVGLTGVIVSLQMRLTRIPSNAVLLHERRVANIDEFLDVLVASEGDYPYAVGWLDVTKRGRGMGRGILQLATHTDESAPEPRRRTMRIPFNFPAQALNRYSVGAFNTLYFNRIPSPKRIRTIHMERFFYPLDSLHDWNRMYGRHGLYQFQCVVPFASGREAIVSLLQEISRSRFASFLAVLKTFGRQGDGMLSFPMPGFTLAMDFPRSEATQRLIERLHQITLKHGGRIYLAKDACLHPHEFEAMYPRLDQFRATLDRVDPEQVMQSDMSRRLKIRRG